MNLDIQFKIKSDPNLSRYLRENSSWYKYLNRNPNSFSEFVSSMRETYQLRPSDRFNKFVNKLDMISSFIDVLK